MDNEDKGGLMSGDINLNLTRKGRLLMAALQKQSYYDTNHNKGLKDSTSSEMESESDLITLADLGIKQTDPMIHPLNLQAPCDLDPIIMNNNSDTESQLLTRSKLVSEDNNMSRMNTDDGFLCDGNTTSFTTLTNVEPSCSHSSFAQVASSSLGGTVAESTNQIDFDSDDSIRDRTFNPTNETIISTSSSSSDDDIPISSLVRASRGRQKQNQRKIIKTKRNKGERYETKSGKIVEERRVTELSDCRMKCREKITRQDQETLCRELWAMGDYNKRTDYLGSLILDVEKKTQRLRSTDKDPKLRTINHAYHLKLNGNMVQVCKVCFLKTFAVTNKGIEILTKKKTKRLSGIITPDKRGSSEPSNKISEDKISAIKDHINSYPIYESHYSRRHTDKRYLPSGLSIATMYDMYKVKVANPVSYGFFGKVFRSMGLSFKKPSLDTCNTCDSLNMKIKVAPSQDVENLNKQLHSHQTEADRAYAMKQTDKENCSDSKRVYSFDLQQCLATPFLQTNIVFYKRLLWTFNLTIFDCFTKKSYCYMWHEAEGGRGANQIASCLYDFILKLPADIKEVAFYSDTCGGQNKNSHVVAMFLCLTKLRPDLKIEHKFLVPGHTHMECDTVHAQIERKKKTTGMTIHLPRDWYNLVRATNKNINVILMDNSMFFNFAQLYKGPLQLRKIDSSGEKFVWHDVKWFCFSGQFEANTIKFKTQLCESDTFKTISFSRRGKANEVLQPFKCYNGPTPISDDKKKDLLSILHLIDNDCHDFYRSLRTTSQNTITDPDLEDFADE